MQYIQLQAQVSSELDQPIEGSFNLFVDTSDNLIKIKNSDGNIIGSVASSLEIEYNTLYSLVQSGSLTAGQYYTITDYQTFYDQPNWTANGTAITTGNYKSGSIEPLVVLAISSESLAPNAYSTLYPKDTIKYDITWNSTEVTENLAKGRIYERIDEVGNRTDYDWRNVVFKRYDSFYAQNIYIGKLSVITTETTGSVIGVDTNFEGDFSIGSVLGVYNPNLNFNGGFEFYEVVDISGSNYMGVTGSYYSNISDTYYSNAGVYGGASAYQTNTVSVNKNVYEYYTFDVEGTPAQSNWYNNYLGDNLDWEVFRLSNNVFRGGGYRDNYFDSNVVGNTFDDDNVGNKCGRNFQYNIITNDFDSNTIGDTFQNNYIRCDFQENNISNNFQSNMITDDDGIDFNFNIINGDEFSNNWFTGYDHFHSNIITDRFYNNIIWRRFGNNVVTHEVYNNLFDGYTDYNQFKQNFYDNKIYNSFQNNVLNTFYNNTILDTFYRNQISGQAFSNVLSGSFFDNTIGDNFAYNTFSGTAGYNQIGYRFDSNMVGDSFGVGGGNVRANKIGNDVYNNTIGRYFYSNTISDGFHTNTIGDYFQQNTVLANNVNNVDFNILYGNVQSIENPNPNIGGDDGSYTDVATTTNGQGTGATIDVTVSSGVASAIINQSGRLYTIGNTLTISGSLIGGGSDLVLNVGGVSSAPVVYQYVDSTILRNHVEELRLTYLGSSGYANVGITEQLD